VIAGELAGLVGDERHLVGLTRQNDAHKFFGGVPFDVQFGGTGLLQRGHIGVAGVAFVRSRMNSDALGSESFAVPGHFYQVRVIRATAVTDEGYFVQVDR